MVRCLQTSNSTPVLGFGALILDTSFFCATSDFYLVLLRLNQMPLFCVIALNTLLFTKVLSVAKSETYELPLMSLLKGSGRSLQESLDRKSAPLTWKSQSDRDRPSKDLKGCDHVHMLPTVLFSLPRFRNA